MYLYELLRDGRLAFFRLDDGSPSAETIANWVQPGLIPIRATGAVTRVLLSATDGVADWTTIGVSPNIIEASWQALLDSLVYGLLHAS